MNVISLKDYAKNNNVTYEAVRQQVVRYKTELESHIIVDGRQQFLDEEAVAFLDAKRQKNPVVIVQQDKDELIEALRNEKETLLTKIAAQADKISALEGWKGDNAIAIAEANHRQALLEAGEKQIKALEAQNARLSEDNEFYLQKAAEAELSEKKALKELTEAHERFETALKEEKEYAEELERWSNLSWLKKIRTPKPMRKKS